MCNIYLLNYKFLLSSIEKWDKKNITLQIT